MSKNINIFELMVRKEFLNKMGVELKYKWKEEMASWYDPQNVVQSMYNPHYLYYTTNRKNFLFHQFVNSMPDFFKCKIQLFKQNLLFRNEYDPLTSNGYIILLFFIFCVNLFNFAKMN